MQSTQFQMPAGDGAPAFVHRFLPDAPPRAVLQVVHGMAEHGARYARLAAALAARGIALYAQDLPGHGRSVARPEDLGHFADREGWQKVLDAVHALRQHIAQAHPGVPLFLLGHSMGSFVLQDYVTRHGEGLAGAIFSASSGDLGPLRAVGLALLRLEAKLRGRRHRSALAEQLSFRDFNRRFRPTRTDFDWLSRDAAEVDRYIADPLCGFRCSAGLWIDLLQACGRLREPQRLARIPRTLPVLIVGGSRDAATAGERGPRALAALYGALPLADLSLQLHADARHELLNETCREAVTQDLIEWLERHLKDRA